MALFGEANKVKKDTLADLVSIKHEIQSFILEMSMAKAFLSESENNVKADMETIRKRLEALLNAIYVNAKYYAAQSIKKEEEKINDEIIFLEQQHKSLEEMEEYVSFNTTNTNLKPLKMGKEKCEIARSTLQERKSKFTNKCAKFVLHPLLSQILEQIETFSLGETIILSNHKETETQYTEDEFETQFNYEDPVIDKFTPATISQNPIRTSFSRSNTTQRNKTKKANSNLFSRQSTKLEASATIKKRVDPNEKKSKLIKRSKTKEPSSLEAQNVKDDDHKDRFRPIAGLKATFTERSASVPLINLSSLKNGAFVPPVPKEEPLPINLQYKETLLTKVHKAGCYNTAITVLPNGTVVLCDNVHDSLQLYNPNTQQISEMECPHPWGVTAISDSTVAVTLHYDKKIILVRVTSVLEKLNEKDIVIKCKATLLYDIKFYAYRLYALCSDCDVHVLDLKGEESNVIRTGLSINSLRYIDVDHEKQVVVVSGEKGVFCINVKGSPIWHFKQPPKGKFVGTGVLIYNGLILVADWENSAIVEIYDDGRKMRSLCDNNIEKPVAICTSENGNSLFVTQGDYDMQSDKTRIVKVLQIGKK